MSRRGSSTSFYRKMHYNDEDHFDKIELVDDDWMKVTFYLKLADNNEASWAWSVVMLVDRIGAWLDFYKWDLFSHYDILFEQARGMVRARKKKDRNKPPHRW